jgi:hypothetical protein
VHCEDLVENEPDGAHRLVGQGAIREAWREAGADEPRIALSKRDVQCRCKSQHKVTAGP